MHQKLVPDPVLILIITQNSYCMQEILLIIRYFEKGLSKSFKKVNFLFFSNLVLFNGQDYEKQNGPGTSVALQIGKQVQKNSFISDVLPDQV